MNFDEAFSIARQRFQAIKRTAWKEIRYIVVVDSLKYPGVTGDDMEYNVYLLNNHLAGPFDTKREGNKWIKENAERLKNTWERYATYTKLKALGIQKDLDFASKPNFTVEQYEENATLVPVPKMTSKRVGVNFLAAMLPSGTLEPYTPSHSDLFATDWVTA